MDAGGFSAALRSRVKRFNGGLFREHEPLKLDAEEISLLIDAGKADWRDVEPAIFGTLLERALDPRERHKLGAHFTPRAYVERLVVPTIIEPVRDDWEAARAASLAEANAGRLDAARTEARRFLDGLTATRVLDHACGTGNFLYVSMVKLKEIEVEARDWLAQLGETQADLEHMERTVDPRQFLGIEINPRAVAIAEVVRGSVGCSGTCATARARRVFRNRSSRPTATSNAATRCWSTTGRNSSATRRENRSRAGMA